MDTLQVSKVEQPWGATPDSKGETVLSVRPMEYDFSLFSRAVGQLLETALLYRLHNKEEINRSQKALE